MEGAPGDVIGSALLERHIVRYYAYYVSLILYLVGESSREAHPSISGSRRSIRFQKELPANESNKIITSKPPVAQVEKIRMRKKLGSPPRPDTERAGQGLCILEDCDRALRRVKREIAPIKAP